MSCPKCNGLLLTTEDMYGKRVSCINCGKDINPPVNPDLLNEDGSLKKLLKGGSPPKECKDIYSWKETHAKRGGVYVRR